MTCRDSVRQAPNLMSFQDSRLVAGVAFKKTFSYAGFEMQPKKYKNPKIALLNIELELKAERDNAEIRVDSVEVRNVRAVYNERQHQLCDNSVTRLAILILMKNNEIAPKLEPYSSVTSLFSRRTVSLAPSLSCCSVDSDDWCKRFLKRRVRLFRDQ